MPTPGAPRRLPRHLSRRLAGLALPLLLALVTLAGCGGSSSAPSLSGTWGGTITEPQMGTNSTLKVADLYFQLSQGGDGKLTGKATLCHGVYGDRPALGIPVRGTAKAPHEVMLQFAQFAFHGTDASANALTLPGTFANPQSASSQTVAASLHPISASAFAAACTGTGTPTP